jgi:MFS family permease
MSGMSASETDERSPSILIESPAVEMIVERKTGRVGAFQSRNFRLLWTGLIIANSGSWMATTAEGWLVTDMASGNASVIIGLIALAFALPMFGLIMIGGAVADRFPRMRMLWIVQCCYLTFSTTLAVVTLLDLIQIWMLIVYSFLNGLVLAFDSPARNALLPDLVPKEDLAGAVSLNSAAYSGAALIGPAIAGALIPIIGVGGVYAFNALSVIAVLVALTRMRNVPEHAVNKQTQGNVWTSIKRGVHFARESRIILGVLAVSVVSGIFARSYSPLLVIFAREEFHVGSFKFGLMVAAPGIGTLLAAFMIASRKDMGQRGKKLWIFVSALAVVLMIFAIMPWYIGALPMLIITGFCVTLTAATMATIIQLQTPPELRGRIMSIYMMTLIAVPSVGTLMNGAVADVIGVRVAVFSGAVIVLLVVALLFFRNPQLREV